MYVKVRLDTVEFRLSLNKPPEEEGTPLDGLFIRDSVDVVAEGTLADISKELSQKIFEALDAQITNRSAMKEKHVREDQETLRTLKEMQERLRDHL